MLICRNIFVRFFSCLVIVSLLHINIATYVFADNNNNCLAPKTTVISTADIQNANDFLFASLINDAYNAEPTKTLQVKNKTPFAVNSVFNTFRDFSFSQNLLSSIFQKFKAFTLSLKKQLPATTLNIVSKLQKTLNHLKISARYVFMFILIAFSSCSDIIDPVKPEDFFEGDAIFSIGKNDNSSSEFLSDPNSFNNEFSANSDFHDKFPRELNTSWFPNIYIHFEIDNPDDLTLYLDAAWQNDRGALIVNVDFYTGGEWKNAGRVVFNSVDKGYINIPSSFFHKGTNNMRISVDKGNGKTTAIYWDQISLKPTSYSVPQEVITMTKNIMDVSLNYFLDNNVIHQSGLPPTAHSASHPYQFQYTNPTEWGYLLQAYVIAAQTGKISASEANTRITKTINTIKNIQNDPNQFKDGLFYSYYLLDDAIPVHDNVLELTVGDCALLWLSLNTIKGWLINQGFQATALSTKEVMDKINIRTGFVDNGPYSFIAHSIVLETGNTEGAWNAFADEGGMVAFAAFASDAINEDEFRRVINNLRREPATWNGFRIEESSYYNAAFLWIQRPANGFPLFESGLGSTFGINSFLPAADAYISYSKYLNIDYPGFSDAMSQSILNKSLVGEFYPPNFANALLNSDPGHITPHGLIVPLAGMRYMNSETLKAYYDALVLLRSDINDIWHDTKNNVSSSPYGFEVLAPSKINTPNYIAANAGRYVFETLSEGYSVTSAWYGLQLLEGKPTFLDYAKNVQGYNEKLEIALNIMYGGGLKDIGEDDTVLSPEQYRILQNKIFSSTSTPVEKTINENNIFYNLIDFNSNSEMDILLQSFGIKNGAYNLTINGQNYILINKDASHYNLAIEHEECELCCRTTILANSDIQGINTDNIAHQIAWGMQILNNNWENTDNIAFIKSQLSSKNINQLVDILKENRTDKRNITVEILKDSYKNQNIRETIENFENSFKESAFNFLNILLKNYIKENIKTYNIDLIREIITPIVKQTKGVIDSYTLRNIIYTGLRENNLIKETAIKINSFLKSLTIAVNQESKNKELINYCS